MLSEDELRTVIREVFLGGDAQTPLPADMDLVRAGICDSFALLELAMEVERKTGCDPIPDSDITVDNFGSIARIQGYLAGRQG